LWYVPHKKYEKTSHKCSRQMSLIMLRPLWKNNIDNQYQNTFYPSNKFIDNVVAPVVLILVTIGKGKKYILAIYFHNFVVDCFSLSICVPVFLLTDRSSARICINSIPFDVNYWTYVDYNTWGVLKSINRQSWTRNYIYFFHNFDPTQFYRWRIHFLLLSKHKIMH
jgi:hypothetical protein